MLSCHAEIAHWKRELPVTFALAGNPNVGKSSVFNWLTGMGVVTANYPGKTVEVQLATTRFKDEEIGVMDLPGTYALGSTSEDQWVARRALLDAEPAVVLVVVDATRLERNLFLPLQLLDLGFRVVIALNLVDEAWREGLCIDTVRLARLLGVPVIPTVAIRGQGLDRLVETALREARARVPRHTTPRYGRDVEEAIGALGDRLAKEGVELPWGLSPRAVALLLLEEDGEALAWARGLPEAERILGPAREAARSVVESHDEPAPVRIARERHGLAGELAAKVKTRVRAPSARRDRFWRLTTSPATGFPLLALVLVGLFATLFWVGDFLSTGLTTLWGMWVSPGLRGVVELALGEGAAARSVLWGVDAGVLAALAVGIPYVFTFYLILSVLEDSGYLNAVAFLTDPFMHRLGLHGRAAIPLVAGAGCNVPAIMGTRVLVTMRERILASTLVCLMPCSARTAVIAGAVAHYVGWAPAIAIYLLVAGLGFGAGWGLNRVLPGRSTGLVMEMFPFRTPSVRTMLWQTWYRFKGFVWVATPVVLVGSFVLGVIYETGLVWAFTVPLRPIVEGWLGLPAVAGLTLMFAVLRKELALQLLLTLAIAQYGAGADDLLRFMDRGQIFTYALVNTLYIPCIATVAVLARELGWRRALLISAFTIALALLAGGVAHRLITLAA
ncbi:MAG: ferrous iron transport protein B [Candidatus Rokubacteria bacterium]|nr:ferrous iron transport protein B [Candidatus Rokubacteria bacterium]